ncbi:MAG TPA: FkbM family methyltransferase [Bacteroidia bacterium]|nr:FkbM family methyltransferase [Bacteroidia bacterium]HNT80709.1 FkbM family methyltransferase [Bacteroidia bacterium]
MQKIVKSGFTVLDIGANVGFITQHLSRFVGTKGKVHAFEPDPTNFKHLAKESRSLQNVSLYQAAIGAKPGVLTLYASNLLNVDHRTYPIADYKYKVEVDVLALDQLDVLKEPIQFIKMDIQGAEYNALIGMSQLLDRNQDIVMLSELSPYALTESGDSASKMLSFLSQKKFRIWLHSDLYQNWTELSESEFEKFDNDPEEKYYNIIVSRKDLNL